MIVITTPTGDIGRQILDRVLDSGEAVRVIARDPSRLQARARGRAEVVQGSHGDADVITKALAGADRLFWLVPPPPFSHPGENLLRQAREIKEQGTFSMANTADRPLPAVATRDVAAVAAALLLDTSWSGQASVPVAGPDDLTPDGMAQVISATLGRTIRYRQVPAADRQAAMLQRGASQAIAQDMADMTEAQNNGIYDAEPRDPDSAAPTSFRQWCQDTLKPAVQA